MLTFFFFGAPVALYVVMASLSRGRPALKGALYVAVGLVILWLAMALLTLSPEVETLGYVGLLALSAAWFIASSLQVLRLRLPDTAPGWIWPLSVIVTFGAVILVVFRGFSF